MAWVYLNALKQLDMFSQNIMLNIGKQSAFKSFTGIIFTAVYAGVMAAVIITQAQNYLSTTSPITVEDSFTRALYPEINLIDNKLNPVFIGYSNETAWIEAADMPKYFTLVTQKIKWISSTDANGNQILTKNFETYPSLPCSQLTSDEFQAFDYMGKDDNYYQSIAGYGWCTRRPKNTTVEGKSSDVYYTLMTLKVLPCSLSTGCKTYDEIVKANFQLILPTTNFNASNKTTPMNFIISVDDIYYIQPYLRQTYTGKVRKRDVQDFEGLLPVWVDKFLYLTLEVLFSQPLIEIMRVSVQQLML